MLNCRRNLFLCLLLALPHLDCGQNLDPDRKRGSTVTMAHPGLQGRGFTPPEFGSERALLFLPLMRIGESGELEGALAESWEYSADSGSVTYHLRTNVRWHDGVPVTAYDIKFSMDLMTHPDVHLENPDFFGTVEVLDESTLRVRDSAGGVDEVFWPKHLLEGLDPAKFYEWDYWKRPVGNGPYRFSRYEPYAFLELDANPDYFGGKPAIERVILKFVGEAGLRELLADTVDAVVGVRPIDALALRDDTRFNIYYHYFGWWIQQVLYWQHKNPLFQDAAVRQALTMAVDRREILRLNHIPEDAPIADAPYSLGQLARNQFPDPIPYAPEKAKALLDGAGWVDADGNGIREKGGHPFRFTALVGRGADGLNEDQAVYIRERFGEIGLEMDILTTDPEVIFQRITRGDFDAAFLSFAMIYVTLFPSWIGYDNPELTDLVRRLLPRRYHADPEEQSALYEQVHAIFRRDVPITFLGPLMQTNIVRREIQGLSTPWRASPLAHVEHLRVKKDRQLTE